MGRGCDSSAGVMMEAGLSCSGWRDGAHLSGHSDKGMFWCCWVTNDVQVFRLATRPVGPIQGDEEHRRVWPGKGMVEGSSGQLRGT